MHQKNPNYGANGHKSADLVQSIIERLAVHSVLDYGCGKGSLGKCLDVPVFNYDPALTGSQKHVADLVTCTDVMEHVEPQFITAVIEDISAHARKAAFFVISCQPGTKRLPNGELAHCSVHPPEWWLSLLGDYWKLERFPEIEPQELVVLCMK